MNTTQNTPEPPKDSMAWPMWKTRNEQIAKFGHAPKTGFMSIKCTVCGRSTYATHPEGRQHSNESR